MARITRQLVALRPAVLVELVHADAEFVEGTYRVSDGDVESSGVLGVLRACRGQQDEIAREEIGKGERGLGRGPCEAVSMEGLENHGFEQFVCTGVHVCDVEVQGVPF